ncbi:MAG TPA: response regulator, partial [Thiotrichales bacterium]|nr:response regulator [Thiotrichales bacterium]HQT05128.1 response regulator [Thiotrichales bacterium]
MSEFNELMQELQRQYRSSLLDRIAELFDLYNQIALTDWQFSQVRAFHHQVHSLTGSAGTFGMKPLSTAARALEVELKQLMHSPEPPTYRQWQNIQQALVGIEQLAASLLTMEAPTYLPDLTPTTSNSEAPLVYLIEDDLEQAEPIAVALKQAGFQLQHFKDLTSFRSERLATDCPDMLILDLMLPEGENAGLEVLTDLKRNAACQPAVICVSVRDDFNTRLAAYRAGANRYMLKPVMTEELVGLVNTLNRRTPDEAYRVVIVDDDPLLLQVQTMQLEAAGIEVKSLNVESIFTTLDQFKPDVLILDVYMPTATGPELASIIREREEYLSLPIIFLSAECDLQQQLMALNLGGDDFLVKPVQSDHLISAVTARAKRARQVAILEARLRNSLYEREREHLAVNQHAIVSVADKHGNILEVNEKFCEVSGYDRSELIGQNHRIVKS